MSARYLIPIRHGCISQRTTLVIPGQWIQPWHVVETAISRHFGIDPSKLHSRLRDDQTASARMAAMALLSHYWAPNRVARHFGRDHTTVAYAIRQMQDRITVDSEFKTRFEATRNALGL